MHHNIIFLLKNYLTSVIIYRHEYRGGINMARVCELSGRGTISGNKRSHSMRATRRTWKVNLQRKTVVINGQKVRIRVSARALKALNKVQSTAE